MYRPLLLLSLLGPSLGLASSQMRVEGTQIIVSDESGQELRGSAIEGAELDLGDLGTLRITHAKKDDSARFPDEVWLLDGQMRAPGAQAFTNVCSTDTGVDGRMVIFSGYLDPHLRYVADPARFSMSCVSGVEAKCLRWGYLPWRSAPIGGESLAPYFETCIRLARADYCGNDQPTTREGTAIDIHDRVGIQQRTTNLPDFDFEAGWGPQGALCVHHARIPENLALHTLQTQCARLATAAIGDTCDEAVAQAQGALIMTRSVNRGPARAKAAIDNAQ